MRNLIQNVQNTLLKFICCIDNLCKHNPKYFQDKVQLEFADTRNKIIILTHIFLIFMFSLDLLTNGPIAGILFRCSLCLIIIAMVFISARYHPQIFKIFYTLLCAIYAPAVIQTGDEGILVAFLGVQIIPLFIYVFTEDIWHFLFQFFVQVVCLNKYFPKTMETTVTYIEPGNFVKIMLYASNLNMMLFCTLMILTHYFMQKAYRRITVVEKKKDEFEHQKTFLLGFSHELRNLINSLTGNVKLASLEALPQHAKDLLSNAEVCGELLIHLINNILDTGKVEIGELEITPSPTKIYGAFERIWGICSELIKRKNLKGQMKIQKNIPETLMIDHYRLTQIFLNLVGNAVKFTERGTIDIIVEWIDQNDSINEKCFQPYPFNDQDEQDEGLFEKRHSFSVFNDNFLTLNHTSQNIKASQLEKQDNMNKGFLKVVVKDSGCGMNKGEIDKLFHKFAQVNSDPSKRKLGTGLGLFITKELCQKMKGEIKAYSKRGKGSAFIFCLPVTCAGKENDHQRDIESLKNVLLSKKLKTMLVDDTPFNHFVLKNFLTNLGIDVPEIAVNGLEAYNKCIDLIKRKEYPQIITMDLDMPIMDGKEASRKIRELEIENNMKPSFLLIISGNCTESEISGCLDKHGRIRADGFLKKPVSVDDLVRVIGNNLSKLEEQ